MNDRPNLLLLALGLPLLLLPLLSQCSGSAIAQDRTPPYWATIRQDRAVMRRGPSTAMRAMWEYHRRGMPMRVIAIIENWRQVQEVDGTTGWMHQSLLSPQRGAIVTGQRVPMRVRPDGTSPIAYVASHGVVGRLGECRDNFCELDVGGRSGWIAVDAIWGEGDANAGSR